MAQSSDTATGQLSLLRRALRWMIAALLTEVALLTLAVLAIAWAFVPGAVLLDGTTPSPEFIQSARGALFGGALVVLLHALGDFARRRSDRLSRRAREIEAQDVHRGYYRSGVDG